MTDIQKREFEFSQQESYTPLEVKAILSQHNTFIENGVAHEAASMKARLSELEAANSEYSAKERTRMIEKLANEVSAHNASKLIKYSNIPSDADEAQIKIIMAETNKDFHTPIDTKTPEVKVVGEVKQTTTENKEFDKFEDL